MARDPVQAERERGTEGKREGGEGGSVKGRCDRKREGERDGECAYIASK